MLNKRWVDYFFNMTDAINKNSKDFSTKVGALLIGKQKQVIATGYNGIPPGCADDPEQYPERYEREKEKYKVTNHAEANMIAFAARHGIATDDTILFCNLPPCITCTLLIITAGINAVYYKADNGKGGWRDDLLLARQLMLEAGVEWHEYGIGGTSPFNKGLFNRHVFPVTGKDAHVIVHEYEKSCEGFTYASRKLDYDESKAFASCEFWYDDSVDAFNDALTTSLEQID